LFPFADYIQYVVTEDSDSDNEISLKIDQYLTTLRRMKLRHTKSVPVFLGLCINLYTTAHRPCMQLALPLCHWDSWWV